MKLAELKALNTKYADMLPKSSNLEIETVRLSVQDIGITDEIIITDNGYLVDGRHRIMIATEENIDELRVKIIPEHEAVQYVIAKMSGRKEKPKQLAFVAVEIMEQTGMKANQASKEVGVHQNLIGFAKKIKELAPIVAESIKNGIIYTSVITGYAMHDLKKIHADVEETLKEDRFQHLKDKSHSDDWKPKASSKDELAELKELIKAIKESKYKQDVLDFLQMDDEKQEELLIEW